MRLRHAAITGISLAALTLATTTPAHAANGDFRCRYGALRSAVLTDPPSGECITIEQATDLLPARAPRNLTGEVATVFLDADCSGDVYFVLNPGVHRPVVMFRSVVFS